jgi:hypothetical protein
MSVSRAQRKTENNRPPKHSHYHTSSHQHSLQTPTSDTRFNNTTKAAAIQRQLREYRHHSQRITSLRVYQNEMQQQEFIRQHASMVESPASTLHLKSGVNVKRSDEYGIAAVTEDTPTQGFRDSKDGSLSSASQRTPSAVLEAHEGIEQYTTTMLVHFYRCFNPSKVKDVNMVVKRFRGRDIELFEKLSRKYKHPDPMKSLPTFFSYINGVQAHHLRSKSQEVHMRQHRIVTYKEKRFAFVMPTNAIEDGYPAEPSSPVNTVIAEAKNSHHANSSGLVRNASTHLGYPSFLSAPTSKILGLSPNNTKSALSKGFAAWMGKPISPRTSSLADPESPIPSLDLEIRGEDMAALPNPVSPLRRSSESRCVDSPQGSEGNPTTVTARITVQGSLLHALRRYYLKTKAAGIRKSQHREPPPRFMLITTGATTASYVNRATLPVLIFISVILAASTFQPLFLSYKFGKSLWQLYLKIARSKHMRNNPSQCTTITTISVLAILLT